MQPAHALTFTSLTIFSFQLLLLPRALFFDTSLLLKESPLLHLEESYFPGEATVLPKETTMFLKETDNPPVEDSENPSILSVSQKVGKSISTEIQS